MVIDRLGSSTVITGSGTRIVGIGQRLADVDLADAGDRDDLARAGFVDRDAVERLGDVELADLDALDGAVGATPRHGLARA